MGGLDDSAGLREHGLNDFVGENLPVPFKGDGVDLNTRANIHDHLMSAILFGSWSWV